MYSLPPTHRCLRELHLNAGQQAHTTATSCVMVPRMISQHDATESARCCTKKINGAPLSAHGSSTVVRVVPCRAGYILCTTSRSSRSVALHQQTFLYFGERHVRWYGACGVAACLPHRQHCRHHLQELEAGRWCRTGKVTPSSRTLQLIMCEKSITAYGSIYNSDPAPKLQNPSWHCVWGPQHGSPIPMEAVTSQ